MDQHCWLAYSKRLDGAFCLPCALFNPNSVKGKFLTKPFRKSQKKSQMCKEHRKLQYHQASLELADELRRSIEQPERALTALIHGEKAQNIDRNRQLLKSLVKAVIFCGRQCIALRGSVENLDAPGNPGNFLAILNLLSEHDSVLRSHLDSPALHNATYLSPRTQNEIIEILGKHIILREIVGEIKAAKFYSILADEVTSHNTEHLALCARFVDSKKVVREEFLSFIQLDRITGKQIAEAIIAFLNENDITIADMRRQGYDGALNVSSSRAGMQARISVVAPQATYVHCSGHCLNLVISKSCSVPDIKHVLDRLQHCSRFFLNSPKRCNL